MSVSQLVRYEQNYTLVASRRTPSTGALESFSEFFSCMQLEYCLREPLSKFEALSTFYWKFISVNILYCIYGTFGPFHTYYLCIIQVFWNSITVTQSEKTDHVLHSTKNEIMIVFISTSFLLAHIKI